MKNTSTLRKKALQRGAIATVVIAASALGISAWAQKEAETSASPAPAATVSNVPAARGQTGPQDMLTTAAHQPPEPITAATSSDPLVRGAYLARMGDCVACHTGSGAEGYFMSPALLVNTLLALLPCAGHRHLGGAQDQPAVPGARPAGQAVPEGGRAAHLHLQGGPGGVVVSLACGWATWRE
mgnify:CR=1 FL=1